MSGILLGKTMGRTDELADRFTSESSLLADLEVRQRMAGRWMMASIQTSFAVMPAAVYWFGGLALAHGSHAITVPTLVAFTTLQTRLFFPVGSLLGVGLDVQTSLALFDRIFEYLDEPIDIVERRRPAPARRRRRRLVRGRLVPLRRRRAVDAERRLVHRPGRHEDGARRRDGRREDDARLPDRAPVRRRAGPRRDRRRRRARPRVRAPGATWSASSRRRPISSTRPSARTCASRSPTRPTRRSRRRPRRRASST